MSKKINQDIKKWYVEISELIQSKNVNNYEFIFSVPEGNTVHQSGYSNIDSKLAIVSCLMENALFDCVVADNNNLESNTNCLVACHYVDHWIERIKNKVKQRIKKHVKKVKTGE